MKRNLVAALLGTILMALVLATAQEPKPEVREVPIYVEIEPVEVPPGATKAPAATRPVKTVVGLAVKIRGVAALALAGKQLEITVAPPQRPRSPDGPDPESECPEDKDQGTKLVASGPLRPEPPATLNVTVGETGIFETTFIPKAKGEHGVEVSGAKGQYRGATSFEVDDLEGADQCPGQLRKELEHETKQAIENVHAAVRALQQRVTELPPSPAKDEAIQKLDEFAKAMQDALPDDEPPDWLNAADHLANLRRVAREMRVATADLVVKISAWKNEVASANQRAPQALADLTRGNVLCDQLDVIINGIKFVDFYLGPFQRIPTYFLDWAKENDPTKLLARILPENRNPASKQIIESALKGMVTFQPTPARLKGGAFDWKGNIVAGRNKRIGEKAGLSFGLASGLNTMAYDLSTFFLSRVFEKYCQQFQGPISGGMTAKFYKEGQLWWKYKISIQGEVILRYPQGAVGDAVALSGEFMGNAMSFRSWDDAIPVLFPSLAKGVVFKTIRNEPLALGDLQMLSDTKLKSGGAGQVVTSSSPVMGTIKRGGAITRNLLTPAFFRIPVRGEIRGDTIRIHLLDATADFDDARAKVTQIMLPVLSLLPVVNSYALPYKGARFMLGRAMDDAPPEFQVKHVGKTLVIERAFQREKKTGDVATGTYDLSIRACNPSCQ